MKRRTFLSTIAALPVVLIPRATPAEVGVFTATGSTSYYFDGTVGVSGMDLDMNTLSIANGDTVTLDSLTFTVPP